MRLVTRQKVVWKGHRATESYNFEIVTMLHGPSSKKCRRNAEAHDPSPCVSAHSIQSGSILHPYSQIDGMQADCQVPCN